MTTNARDFLNEIADILRAHGREVEVEVTTESFGEYVWMYSPAPRWYDRSISLTARYSTRTNRWSLGTLNVGPSSVSKGFTETTRRRIRSAADIYGRA